MNQENKNIDNLFKERLEGYSGIPSDKVWKQIETTLQQQGVFKGFIARNKKWAAVFILLIISAGAFLVWNISSENSNSTSQNIVLVDKPATPLNINTISTQDDILKSQRIPEENAPSQKIVQLPETSKQVENSAAADEIADDGNKVIETAQLSEAALPIEEAAISKTSILLENDYPEGETSASVKQVKENIQLVETTLPPNESAITDNKLVVITAPDVTINSTNIVQTKEYSSFNEVKRLNVFTASMLNPNLVPDLLSYDLYEQSFFYNIKTETGIKQISDFTPWERMTAKPSYLCVGISAGPEYVFYSKEKHNTAFNYGVDIYYNKSGFVARSGIFLSRYGDQGEYTLDYQRIDSLGYMYSVESFTVDPNNPDSVIFNMKIEGVYDSINITESKFTDAWYSYLQVPLLLGYTYSRSGNLTFDITAGPVFNLLVNQRTQRPEMPQGENVFISDVQENTTPWLKTNWQLMASVSIHYRLSNRLRIKVEPIYRYYVHPVYTGNTSADASPYSFGGKVGLLYKF